MYFQKLKREKLNLECITVKISFENVNCYVKGILTDVE